MKGGTKKTASQSTLGMKAQDTWVSFLSPTYPGQGSREASSLELPTGTDKLSSRRSLFPLAKELGTPWPNNREPLSNTHTAPVTTNGKPLSLHFRWDQAGFPP